MKKRKRKEDSKGSPLGLEGGEDGVHGRDIGRNSKLVTTVEAAAGDLHHVGIVRCPPHVGLMSLASSFFGSLFILLFLKCVFDCTIFL